MTVCLRYVLWALLSIGCLALVMIVYAFLIEPSRLMVRHWPIKTEQGPTAPLTVGFLTDPHCSTQSMPRRKLEAIAKRLMQEKPDLIVIGGDFLISGLLGNRQLPYADCAGAWASLDAPLGVYTVLGNHDNWEDPKGITAALEAVGIRVLANESVKLAPGFWLVGLSDFLSASTQHRTALRNVPDDALVLALTHDPAGFRNAPLDRYALMLAGHTHGGQIYLPGLFKPRNASSAPAHWIYGQISTPAGPLIISSGLGKSILPARVNMPPEIVLLEWSKR